ncbi:MAG: DUF4916 domain-containing protein [Gaiellaceae bacterium]
MTRLPDEQWEWVQTVLPIAVVDVMPLHADKQRVGLIRRETPHQGERWNLIGGRVAHGESLVLAIEREIREALGDRARVDLSDAGQPLYVAQYGPWRAEPFSFDPRKHAIGMTYLLPVAGPLTACGEALSFAWFMAMELPARSEWGFEQDRVAEACLARAQIPFSFSTN